MFFFNDKQKKVDNELTHITQEMYKKNLELTERNKMLNLLRKIDQIILSSLTKVEQIADQVTNVIINETSIKSVFIYFVDKPNGLLTPLSIAFAKTQAEINDDILHIYYTGKISLSDEKNSLVMAMNNHKIIEEKSLSVFFPQLSSEIVEKNQQEIGIQRFLIHPFYIRKESAGVIVFGLGTEEITLQYWSDFIVRLPEVISIAIDNAILYQKIEETNEQLKQLDKMKDEFVSVASHELRTPMTAIKSYLWMAIDRVSKQPDAQLKGYLDTAYVSTERLLALVENMLTVSRIEGKRLSLKIEPLNLLTIIEAVFNELKIKAEEKQIQFTYSSEIKEPIINGDKDKLREVFQNLIGNALKFTPASGQISATISGAGNQLMVQIFNSGSFISEEDIPKLFEKFRKLDKSYTNIPQETGTGLGLYICKQIVELHNGRIDVISEENSGTTFTVSFRLK